MFEADILEWCRSWQNIVKAHKWCMHMAGLQEPDIAL